MMVGSVALTSTFLFTRDEPYAPSPTLNQVSPSLPKSPESPPLTLKHSWRGGLGCQPAPRRPSMQRCSGCSFCHKVALVARGAPRSSPDSAWPPREMGPHLGPHLPSSEERARLYHCFPCSGVPPGI